MKKTTPLETFINESFSDISGSTYEIANYFVKPVGDSGDVKTWKKLEKSNSLIRTPAELKDELGRKDKWADRDVKFYINNLVDKGILKSVGHGKFKFTDEYIAYRIKFPRHENTTFWA